jgi:hypothetical protein
VDTQPKNNITNDNIDSDDADEDDYLRNPKPQNEHVGFDEDIVAPNALQVVHSSIQKDPSYVADRNLLNVRKQLKLDHEASSSIMAYIHFMFQS